MCPQFERCYDYKHGRLNEADRIDMQRHITGCSRCSDFLKALGQANALLEETARTEEVWRSSCENEEAITGLLTGSLPEPQSAAAYAHLAQCVVCRKHFVRLSELLKAADSEEAKIPSSRLRWGRFKRAMASVTQKAPPLHDAASSWLVVLPRWLLIPAVGLLLLIIAVSARSVYTTREADRLVAKGTEDLLSSFGVIRPSDVRLSGGFVWSPLHVRGAQDQGEQKSLAQAEKELIRAWDLRPNSSQTNHALGRFYVAKKRPDLAEKYLTLALRSAPESASVRNDLGVLAYERNDFEKAARYFSEAMRLDPKYREPVFNMAFLQLYVRRDGAAARPLVELYRKLEPDSAWLSDLESELRHLSRMRSP